MYGSSNSWCSYQLDDIIFNFKEYLGDISITARLNRHGCEYEKVLLLEFPSSKYDAYSGFEVEYYRDKKGKLCFCIKVDVESVGYLTFPNNPRYIDLFTARYFFSSDCKFIQRIVTRRYGMSKLFSLDNLDTNSSVEGGYSGGFIYSDFNKYSVEESKEKIYNKGILINKEVC